MPTTSFDFWTLRGSLFNASGYTIYIKNVLAGLKLNYYFQYSTECTQSVQNLLSDIYLGNKIYTCQSDPKEEWTTLPFFVSYSISTDLANSFYKCFLFGRSIY